MRQTTRAAGVLAVLMFASACGSGDPTEAVVNDMLNGMNEMSDILDTVKDEASLKDAATKLQAIATRMQDVKKRMDGVAPEKMAEIQKKYADKSAAAMMRFLGALKKASSVPGAEAALANVMKQTQ